ncbi:MAG: hypothetical protein ING44_11815 [Telmatospirillum sp.]|nr:hypothetical protein [Telmatospirillum sp.]
MDVERIYPYSLSDDTHLAPAMVAVRDGSIRSADTAGRTEDGTYRIDDEGILQASITTSFAAGAQLLGRSPGPDAWQFTLDFAFKRGLEQQCFFVETPVGELELAISKVSGFRG